ncbi:MAG: efflux RND transporter periplasmic adaptor subunit [Kangiellaceae bacterium]
MKNFNRKKTTNSSLGLKILFVSLFTMNFSIMAQDAPARPPSPVQVMDVKLATISPSTDILGTVFSRNQVQLTAGVTGKLEWVVEPGSFVKQGDLVAQIELLPLQLRHAEQEAQLKRAKINLQYLERQLKRQRELKKSNSASQTQLDETLSQFELGESDLEIAKLQLKQSKDQLARATIRAPFNGVITQRMRRAGFDVGRSEVLLHLLDTENLEVRLFVPVKYLPFTQPGSEVTLSSDTSDGNHYSVQAIATTIIPAADARSQTFEIRVKIPVESSDYWTSGQLVKVTVPIASKSQLLSVHRDALILRRDGAYVVKVDQDNKAHRIKVNVGKGQQDWVTVEGDLNSGDKVAIRGAERLQEGQNVVIQKEATL